MGLDDVLGWVCLDFQRRCLEMPPSTVFSRTILLELTWNEPNVPTGPNIYDPYYDDV